MFYKTCSSKSADVDRSDCCQQKWSSGFTSQNTYRNKIAGVVHDISASGNTVYIEPVRWSNWAKKLLVCEQMSAMKCFAFSRNFWTCPPSCGWDFNDAWIIGHLDLIRAKVRFIQERQTVVPQLSENQEIQLLHVCHPLVKMPSQMMFILVKI